MSAGDTVQHNLIPALIDTLPHRLIHTFPDRPTYTVPGTHPGKTIRKLEYSLFHKPRHPDNSFHIRLRRPGGKWSDIRTGMPFRRYLHTTFRKKIHRKFRINPRKRSGTIIRTLSHSPSYKQFHNYPGRRSGTIIDRRHHRRPGK